MLLLERDELVEEPVVLGVRDLGLVEDVVSVEVVVQLLASSAARAASEVVCTIGGDASPSWLLRNPKRVSNVEWECP